MAEKNIKARGWRCTLNNYTEEQHQEIIEWCNKNCVWWIIGEEIAPTTGTPHLQMAWYFKNAKHKNSLIKIWKHVEGITFLKMDRSCEENRNYCSKDGKYLEGGVLPSQGKRTDLSDIRDKILSGTKVSDLAEEDPDLYHQYGRTLEKLEDIYLEKVKRTEMTMGVWFYGKSGVGKSYKAGELAKKYGKSYKFSKLDKGWWDNYRGEEVVIIDDFRGAEITYDQLLEMVDKYEYSVPRRGRAPFPFTSLLVIVTSPLPPWEVYKRRHENDGLDQLLRRFTVVELTEVFEDKANNSAKMDLAAALSDIGVDHKTSVLAQKRVGNNMLSSGTYDNIELPSSIEPLGARSSTCLCKETFCECN